MLPPRKFKAKKIPAKRAKPRKVKTIIKCRAHLNWVIAEFDCSIKGRVDGKTGQPHVCAGRIDPDHVVTRGASGGDEQVWPLCRKAHDLRGQFGLPEFERRYNVDAATTAENLWRVSPAGRAYRFKNKDSQ